MTQALQRQGQVFSAVALMLAVASLLGARLSARDELLVMGVLVLLLGMPHGAFDALVARRLWGALGVQGWALFSLCYVGLAVVVVGLWLAAPSLFLCLFLVFSALHFGGDLAAGASWLARGLYGGAVIVLPALWHGPELQQLAGWVAGPASAARVVPVLGQLAPPWLAATVVLCVLQARPTWQPRQPRPSRQAAGEWAALAVLALAAPPLVAFSAYFCLMHSPRHILRVLAGLPAARARQAWRLALWPTLAVLGAGALLALLGWLGRVASGWSLEAGVMQTVFVGLAALTLPHMALLERARRSAPLPNR